MRVSMACLVGDDRGAQHQQTADHCKSAYDDVNRRFLLCTLPDVYDLKPPPVESSGQIGQWNCRLEIAPSTGQGCTNHFGFILFVAVWS